MGLGVFTAWSVATLIVPIALPFATLLFVKTAFVIKGAESLYRSAVADGQLLWLTVSLAASAVFDASQTLEKELLIGLLSLVWFFTLMSIAVFFIALWTVGSLNGVRHVPASAQAAPASASAAQTPSGLSQSALAMKEDALINISAVCLGVTVVSYALFKGLV